MRPRLTGRGSALLGGGTALALGGPLLGVPDLTRWGLFALGLVALSALTVALSRPRVEVKVGPPAAPLSVGHPTSLDVRIVTLRSTRGGTISLPIPPVLAGGTTTSTALVDDDLPADHALDLSLRVSPIRRGVHRIPPATVDMVDPLGLARGRAEVGAAREVLVAPRLHPLDALPGAALSAAAGPATRSAAPSPLAEVPASARPYAPGDDRRRIHWPMSAHRGELMVRQEEPEGGLHVALVLDPRLADGRHPTRFEWGVELLASAVVACDEAGADVSLVVTDPGATRTPQAPASAAGGGGTTDDPDGTRDTTPRVVGSDRAGASRVLGTGREECLRALALAPTRPPGRERRAAPPAASSRETAGTDEGGYPGRTTTVAAHTVLDDAGWVLLVTGTRASEQVCALVTALPPGTSATAVVVADSAVARAWPGDGRVTASSTTPGEQGSDTRLHAGVAPHVENADESEATRAVAMLGAAGAHVVVVSDRTPPAEAWREAVAPLDDARVGGWRR